LPKATSDQDFPEPVRRLEAARWGLVPGFAKSPQDGPPLFNARSEDISEKATFQNAVKTRRAVVPATGYYEWQAVDGVKTPRFIALPGDELLLFAGLYEWWRNPAAADGATDKWLLSATILTRPSAASLAEIHDRMPVFLDADLVEGWLDPQEEGTQELVDEVVAGAGEVAERAEFHEVGAEVGNVRNNTPTLMEPIDQ
jgi:putative SOS response-associated peptidase YedK